MRIRIVEWNFSTDSTQEWVKLNLKLKLVNPVAWLAPLSQLFCDFQSTEKIGDDQDRVRSDKPMVKRNAVIFNFWTIFVTMGRKILFYNFDFLFLDHFIFPSVPWIAKFERKRGFRKKGIVKLDSLERFSADGEVHRLKRAGVVL